MESKFMRVNEVAEALDTSVSYAYRIIRMLNNELREKGFITVAGKVSRQYFNERVYGGIKEDDKDGGV